VTTCPDLEGRDLVSSLGHRPSGRWTFDEDVTAVFDDMLARSIPAYGEMRRVTTAVAARYYQPGTDLVDLCCSKGGGIAPVLDARRDVSSVVGVEVAPSMRAEAVDRFRSDPRVKIRADDLCQTYPPVTASVTLAILTVQFTPIEYRHRILAAARRSTVPGGILVLVEKVLGSTPESQEALVELYHDHKHASGYTRDEIAAKRVSLQGTLVPVSARQNEELLFAAGFTSVECVWRSLNFAGWVARVPHPDD
jgi:tRNA (cmo5U34)-methyltransferase